MAERSVTAMSVDKDLGELAGEVKDLNRTMTDGLANLRTDLAGVKNDLRWIKGIGAALLAGSGWMIWTAATVTSEVGHQGTRLEQAEKRLDVFAEKIDAKLEALLLRNDPRAPTGKANP